jgi:hypothetical protein
VKPHWYFFPEPSPKTEGWNDPAAQHFTGHQIKGLVRESIQNSLDNHSDVQSSKDGKTKPVLIKFDLSEINKSDIPDLDNYKKHLEMIRDHSVDDEAKEGATEALNVLSRQKIKALKIGDYNTKGASGSDLNENSNWYRLVQSVGSSQKTGNSGGSFGIGKSSFLANSALRMVFFSTKCHKNQSTNFIGISRLCTHHFEKYKVQEKGYCSIDHGKAITDTAQTPDIFKRTLPGLDVFVIGLRSELDEAFQKIVEEVCANYFAAIFEELCEIEVISPKKRIIIKKENFEKIFSSFLPEENQGLFCAFKAFTGTKIVLQELKYIGKCELKILIGENFPNRVAYLRRGMLIKFRNFQCPIKYAATFRSLSHEDRLRKLEPPAHNDWETDRYTDVDGKKIIGKEVLKIIESFIRNELSKLYDVSSNDSISLQVIQKLFRTDDPEKNNGQAKGNAAETSDFPDAKEVTVEFETTERKPVTSNNFPNIGTWADVKKLVDVVVDPDDEKRKIRKNKKQRKKELQPSSFLKDFNALEADIVTWKNPQRPKEYQVRLVSKQAAKKVYIIFGWQDTDGDIDVITPAKVLFEKTKKLKSENGGLFGPLTISKIKKHKFSVFTENDNGYGLAASIYKKK